MIKKSKRNTFDNEVAMTNIICIDQFFNARFSNNHKSDLNLHIFAKYTYFNYNLKNNQTFGQIMERLLKERVKTDLNVTYTYFIIKIKVIDQCTKKYTRR